MFFLFLLFLHEGHAPVEPLETGEILARIQTLQKRADAQPESLYGWNQLGEAYLQLGQVTAAHSLFHQADDCFQKALKLVPENKTARYGQVRALMGIHRFHEALTALRPLGQGPDVDPIFSELYFDLHFALGNASEAYALARLLVLEHPSFQSDIRLAQILAYFGQNEQARSLLGQWEKDPKIAPFQRAWCATRIGDSWLASDAKQADAAYDRALELDPACHYAHLQIAKLDCASGHAADAVQRLSQVVNSNPRPEFRLQLADALRQNHQPIPAANMLKELAQTLQSEVDAGDWGHVRLLCEVWRRQGIQPEQQIVLLEKERREIRKDREGIIALGWALLTAGQYDSACNLFQEGAQDAGITPEYLWPMAQALRLAKRQVPARYLVQRLEHMPSGYLNSETQTIATDLMAWSQTSPPIPTLVRNTPQTGR
ncbi:MAG: hypothetical protein H6510_09215 [Acidobacteria bacterium]|nr:hypothetical protein [Acidobacteriota bacterium]